LAQAIFCLASRSKELGETVAPSTSHRLKQPGSFRDA